MCFIPMDFSGVNRAIFETHGGETPFIFRHRPFPYCFRNRARLRMPRPTTMGSMSLICPMISKSIESLSNHLFVKNSRRCLTASAISLAERALFCERGYAETRARGPKRLSCISELDAGKPSASHNRAARKCSLISCARGQLCMSFQIWNWAFALLCPCDLVYFIP